MATSIEREILEEIKKHKTIVITRHIRPDGDAIGSAIGLRELLFRSFPEKKVYAIGDEQPESLKFCGIEDEGVQDYQIKGALLISVDTPTKDRLAFYKPDLFSKIIKIDHHVEVEKYGDINYVVDYSSTAAVIIDLWDRFKLELKMTKFAALPLAVGVISDSQRFKVGLINRKLFLLMANLAQYDVDFEEIYANLYIKPKELFELSVKILSEYKFTKNQAVYLYFNRKTTAKYKLSHKDITSFLDSLDSIQGSLIWMVFHDHGEGEIRVSLRSRSIVVRDLALNYKGGGHLYAAGLRLKDENEMKKFLDEVDELLERYKKKNHRFF